jgi:hypothetical protein
VKLYLVEIGGMRDGHLFEIHEVHAMVAPDDSELVSLCAARFARTMKSAHLDGWVEFDLDEPGTRACNQSGSLFVAELGRNSSASMREQHDYRFLTAASWKDAVQAARQGAPGWHVDACVNLDELAQEHGYILKRGVAGEAPQPRSQARYVRFIEPRVPA